MKIKLSKKEENLEYPEDSKKVEGLKKNPLREFLETIIFVVVFVLFLNVYLVQGYQIPTGSMEKTLLIGDRIFVNKFIFMPIPSFLKFLFPVKDPERGDITIFKSPEYLTKVYVKRLVGLPEETIRIRNKKVFIDDERITFPGKERFVNPGFSKNYGPVQIPSNHFFMMGDNRDRSADSRKWGFLNRKFIKGKVLFVYFSIQNPKLMNSEEDKSFFKTINKIIRWNRILKFVK